MLFADGAGHHLWYLGWGVMLILGSGQRKDTLLCRIMQCWIAPGWICTPNPFPGTRETLSALSPLPGVSFRLFPSSCSFSWSFWALLLPRPNPWSCLCWGAVAFGGSILSPLWNREMFPPPQPRLPARDTSKAIGFPAPCEQELEREGLGGFSIVPARWIQLGLSGV